MGALADALGGKTAGELIRASDWNGLIDAIEAMDTRLTTDLGALSTSVDTRISGLDGRVGVLEGQVDTLQTQVGDLTETVEALRQNFRRVTMRTARANAVLGEVIEIIGRVTDLGGNPLDLTNAATRPWIDFVTVWGQLKPAPGSQSIGGVGNRSISVRVDAQGEARVLLRSEHVHTIRETEEQGVISALGMVVQQTGRTVSETILAASTPMEAQQAGAFRVMSQEYSRVDAGGIRGYADSYYVQNPHLVDTTIVPGLHQNWHDYRTTVMAFAKSDSSPLTADTNLGACSIQVTFRDWIGPWVILDFIPEAEILVGSYEDRFRDRISDVYIDSIINVRDEIETILDGKGVIGKLRDYTAMETAISGMNGGPSFLPDLTETLHNSIVVQHATELGQTFAVGLKGSATSFGAMAGTGAKADIQGAKVTEQVTGYVDQQLGSAQQQLTFQVQQQQATFRNELFAEGGMIQNVSRNLNVVSGQMQGVQQALNAKADIQVLARFLPG